MLTTIHPKLPMRNKNVTLDFYTTYLGFSQAGTEDYEGYLMLKKDAVEIHFFEFKQLQPEENDGQVYIRSSDIQALYKTLLDRQCPIHPNGQLSPKPWGQIEFSVLDPDFNLLTFGQTIDAKHTSSSER